MADDMKVNAQRARELAENLNVVVQKINNVNKAGRNVRILSTAFFIFTYHSFSSLHK